MALEGGASARRRPERIHIIAGLFHRLRERDRKDGAGSPDSAPEIPRGDLDLKSGSTLIPRRWSSFDQWPRLEIDPKDVEAQTPVKAGKQLDGPAQSRDDGTTMLGSAASFREATPRRGNEIGAARRERRRVRRPSAPNWAGRGWVSRRILDNRASADSSGKLWNLAKSGSSSWSCRGWVGLDVPHDTPSAPSENASGPSS